MDSEDEDVKRAIALSLQDHEAVTRATVEEFTLAPPGSTSGTMAHSHAAGAEASPAQPVGMPGLDRALMERERLARLAKKTGKRERSISPPHVGRASKLQKFTPTSNSQLPETGLKPPSPKRLPQTSPLSVPQAATSETSNTLRYPGGRLFKTWAFGHARVPGRDIKIEEVIERHAVKTAVLSAFQFDYEWLFSKLNTTTTNIQLVAEGKGPDQRAMLKHELESLGPNLKVCLPPMDGAFCMHSKLMLLFHADKLRVVVPSANLIAFDWGESGIMENTVWLIDLPRLASEASDKAHFKTTDFLLELEYFLRKQTLPAPIIQGLRNFDWAATAPYAFVASIGGHTLMEGEVSHSGITGLSAAVQRFGLSTQKTEVEMTSSSVGSLKVDFLANLYAACAGTMPTSTTVGNPQMVSPASAKVKINDHFRLYFPTDDYVANSTGGIASGGTIWFDRSYYERANFPRRILHEFIDVRPGMLSHSKLIFVRGVSIPPPQRNLPTTSSKTGEEGSNTKIAPTRQIAWLYSGSANCSEAAWGTPGVVKKSGPNKGLAKIYCRNWECGVVMPVEVASGSGVSLAGPSDRGRSSELDDGKERDPDETESESEDEGDGPGSADDNVTVPGWDVFAGLIDGPFRVPAPSYGDKAPWYVKERRSRGGHATANSAED